jgi:hypothetical protein
VTLAYQVVLCNRMVIKLRGRLRTRKNVRVAAFKKRSCTVSGWWRNGDVTVTATQKKRCLHCKIQLTFYDNMILQSKKYFSKEILMRYLEIHESSQRSRYILESTGLKRWFLYHKTQCQICFINKFLNFVYFENKIILISSCVS